MDPSQASFRTKLKYRFDNTLSRGSAGLIAYLALSTVVIVVIIAVLLTVTRVPNPSGHGNFSFFEGAWQGLLRTLDTGTMAGDTGFEFRSLSLATTIFGIFIVSALIGIITTGLERRIDELRKGRSPVIEAGHTLVLGWSEKLHSIISELIIANENQKDACIVVMSPRDKVEMEDDIFSRITGKMGPTRVVCRTGDPTDPTDLALVNPLGSRSVIVLSPDGDENPDPHAVKVVLGLMGFDRQFGKLRVTVELQEEHSAAALTAATEDRIRTVVSTDLIARITAQVCRQVGMSLVYGELLDFDGDELYFATEPRLYGRTYGQALLSFETSSVIGIRDASGTVRVNPPMSTVINDGDQIIAISEDDDTIVISSLDEFVAADVAASHRRHGPELKPEHTLLMGWSTMAPRILRELDQYVTTGSTVTVLLDGTLMSDLLADGVELGLKNLTLRLVASGADESTVLERELGSTAFDQVVLLSYRDVLPVSEADARTLLSLLQLRRIMRKVTPDRNTSIVTELLDVRAVQLARVANPDDFVVSERLTSLLLAQLSENPELDLVFRELMDAEGSEITLRAIESYGVTVGSEGGGVVHASYGSLVAAARAHGDTAIGVRSPSLTPDEGLGGGVVVNPRKAHEFSLQHGDQLIVIA